MRKGIRRLLIGSGCVLGVLIALVLGVGLFFDLNSYKPEIEASVSKATGMKLQINGKASLTLVPHLGIGFKDVRLENRGSRLFTAAEVQVSARILPFVLHHEVIIDRVSILSPDVSIEKSQNGRMNYTTAARSTPPSPAGEGKFSGQVHKLSIKDGKVTYLDRSTGKKVEFKGVDVQLSQIDLSKQAAGSDLPKSLTFRGDFRADSLSNGAIVVSNLRSGFRGDHGLIHFDSTNARIFGGEIGGNAQLDLRGKIPKLAVAQKASHIDLGQIPMSSGHRISGTAEAAINLTASVPAQKTANGTISLTAQNIALAGMDIDALASELKTAQGFALAQIGPALVSGPIASVAGQAPGAAGQVAKATESKSTIRTLVSDWKVHDGIAQTRDVAFSTGKNIVAFKGDVNIVNDTYQNFYIATVDSKGCSKNKIGISGPLKSPHPNAGSVVSQIAKSYPGQGAQALGSEGSKIAGMLGMAGGKTKGEANAPAGCDHFYSGAALRASGMG